MNNFEVQEPLKSAVAKSKTQESLIDHSLSVKKIAEGLIDTIGVKDKSVKTFVTISGVLHDGVKITKAIQELLKKNQSSSEEDTESYNSPRHHEVMWAYLFKRYSIDSSHPILHAIYWHHARPVDNTGAFYQTYSEILSYLDEEDFSRLDMFMDWARHVIGPDVFDSVLKKRNDEHIYSGAVPTLFNQNEDHTKKSSLNAQLLLTKAILVLADRIASSLTPEQVSDFMSDKVSIQELLKFIEPTIEWPEIKTDKIDFKRFAKQQKLALQAAGCNTTVVKATAGFGKTIIGLLWAMARNNKVLWVCPRNAVAEAVYENILSDLEMLGLTGVSVELILTNKRQKYNKDSTDMWSSDIVVTNIDGLLQPVVENTSLEKTSLILSRSIVFDEYHEFNGDNPIFYGFLTVMKIRHMLCRNLSTLLLSATDALLYKHWSSDDNPTLVLPEEFKHYPAVHNRKYTGKAISTQVAELPSPEKPNTLCISNTVLSSQEMYLKGGFKHIVHSQYTNGDKALKLSTILGCFGKNGTSHQSDESVSSALIMQAAFDASFNNLIESIASPEATLQRLGRLDRWYKSVHKHAASYLACLVSSQSENFMFLKERGPYIYDSDLRHKWFHAVVSFIGSHPEFILDEFYELYNSFCKDHAEEIMTYQLSNAKKSLKELESYGPTKPRIKSKIKSESSQSNSSSKSIRSPDGSLFYTVRDKTTGKWIGPEDGALSDGGVLLDRIEKELATSSAEVRKNLVKISEIFPRHKLLNSHKKSITVSQWKKLAKNKETPFPLSTHVYDKVIGVHRL